MLEHEGKLNVGWLKKTLELLYMIRGEARKIRVGRSLYNSKLGSN